MFAVASPEHISIKTERRKPSGNSLQAERRKPSGDWLLTGQLALLRYNLLGAVIAADPGKKD
jgi:hypothetical protein